MATNEHALGAVKPGQHGNCWLAAARLLAAVASGAALVFSLPPINWEWLGWISMVPLLIAAQGLRPLEQLGLGLLAGLTAAVIAAGGHVAAPTFPYPLFLFGWFGLYLGVSIALAASLRRMISGIPWVAAVAAAGILLERLWLATPLPVHLALTQSRNPSLLPLCSITGIWGVSYLLWWVNAAIPEFLSTRRLNLLGATAVLIILALQPGWFRPIDRRGIDSALRVGAVQNCPFPEALAVLPGPKPGGAKDNDTSLERLTRQATSEGARLVVWPEMGLQSGISTTDASDPTRRLARLSHTLLAVGYLEDAAGGRNSRPFDSAALIDTDGTVRGIHPKIHPFLGERSEIQRGHAVQAWPTSLGMIGMEICFDTCYPDVTRALANQHAVLVCMPTFDPPCVGGVVHYLHSTILPFRASESGLPFVRADSNGLSEVVSREGGIYAELPVGIRGTLTEYVDPGDGFGTFYSRWGDWVVWLCAGLLAACAYSGSRRNGKSIERRDHNELARTDRHSEAPQD